ncbi:glycosyltransferase family 9 protein, partial [Chroococcidiopsidales cyanobacterium LEGE 13417]|nr:glycosyltransferase family 9 protein [Chroococcidiopsidales cyanobacterium LEGE 13417]
RLVDRIITHTTTWQDPAKEKELVENLSQFDFEAAIILTKKNESPYPFAYLAYLAEIPIRMGRSREFGGSVISG